MSGSEKRQRQNVVPMRLNDAEHIELKTRADKAGLSLAGYMRSTVLGGSPPRQSRRPPVNKQELARVLAALGKLGSNVNQMARVANSGGWPDSDKIEYTAFAIFDMRVSLMAALGVTPEERRTPKSIDA